MSKHKHKDEVEVVVDHPADVEDQDLPLAERVEVAAGFEPKHYGER